MKNLLLLYARSAAGKTTVERGLGDRYSSIVTCTTRKKRENEVEGVDYYFENIANFDFEDIVFPENNIVAQIQIGADTNWRYGIRASEFDRIQGNGIMSVISAKYLKDIADYAKSIGINVKIIYLEVDRDIRYQRLLDRKESQLSINARFDFEDQYSVEEIKELFPDILLVDGSLDKDTVLKNVKKELNYE